MTYETIKYAVDDGLAKITFNRLIYIFRLFSPKSLFKCKDNGSFRRLLGTWRNYLSLLFYFSKIGKPKLQ